MLLLLRALANVFEDVLYCPLSRHEVLDQRGCVETSKLTRLERWCWHMWTVGTVIRMELHVPKQTGGVSWFGGHPVWHDFCQGLHWGIVLHLGVSLTIIDKCHQTYILQMPHKHFIQSDFVCRRTPHNQSLWQRSIHHKMDGLSVRNINYKTSPMRWPLMDHVLLFLWSPWYDYFPNMISPLLTWMVFGIFTRNQYILELPSHGWLWSKYCRPFIEYEACLTMVDYGQNITDYWQNIRPV